LKLESAVRPYLRPYLRLRTCWYSCLPPPLRIAAFALAAAICLPPVAGAADPAKVAHLALAADPPGFDPATNGDVSAGEVEEIVFDRLLTYDYLARPARLVPMAAEAMPEVTDAGKTYTLRIRKGIYFTPDPAFKGSRRELTAQDYVYSCLRFLDPKLHSPYEFLFRGKIVGLDALRAAAVKSGKFDYDAKIAGLEAIDRYTLRIRLNARDDRFQYILAHPNFGALAREVVERYGDDVFNHPIGTGPYVLKEWVPGTRIVVEANPDYRGFIWDFAPGNDARDRELAATMRGKKMPQVGRAEISIMTEDSARWLAFDGGQLDVTPLPPRFQKDAMAGDRIRPELAQRGIAAYRAFLPSITYTAFNLRDAVIGGMQPERIALRRAIAMSFDVGEIVRVIRNGSGVKLETPIPPDIAGYDPGYRSSTPYDPELANRLLDRYGYRKAADGYRRLPNGKPLLVTKNTRPDSSYRDLDVLWKKSMDRIGLKLELHVLPFNEAAKLSRACKFSMFSDGWAGDYPDGENFLQLFYGPNIGESNDSCYQSNVFDRLFEQARALPDSPERNRLFIDMARRLEADTVWIPEVADTTLVMLHPWVQGHKFHPFLTSALPYIDLLPH
jgi:ABC-type transport system substrate-binding protein